MVLVIVMLWCCGRGRGGGREVYIFFTPDELLRCFFLHLCITTLYASEKEVEKRVAIP